MSKLTAEDVQIVQQVFQSVASLSIVGSSFVIITSLLYPALRTFPISLVPILSLVDLITVTSYLISPSYPELAGMIQSGQPSNLCLAQGILMTWASVASAMWPAGISVIVYLRVVQGWRLEDYHGRVIWSMVGVVGGTAGIVTLASGLAGVYGPAGAWCWIQERYMVWRWSTAYLFGWASCFVSMLVTFLLRIHVCKIASKADNNHDTLVGALQERVKRVQLFPLILVFVWIWPTTNRLYEALSGGQQILALFILHRGFQGCTGLFNSIAFGYTARETVMASLRPRLLVLCPCMRRCLDAPSKDALAIQQLTRETRHKPKDSLIDITLNPSRTARVSRISGGEGIQLSVLSSKRPRSVTHTHAQAVASVIPINTNNSGGEEEGTESEDERDAEVVLPRGSRNLSFNFPAHTQGNVTMAKVEGATRLSLVMQPGAALVHEKRPSFLGFGKRGSILEWAALAMMQHQPQGEPEQSAITTNPLAEGRT